MRRGRLESPVLPSLKLCRPELWSNARPNGGHFAAERHSQLEVENSDSQSNRYWRNHGTLLLCDGLAKNALGVARAYRTETCVVTSFFGRELVWEVRAPGEADEAAVALWLPRFRVVQILDTRSSARGHVLHRLFVRKPTLN